MIEIAAEPKQASWARSTIQPCTLLMRCATCQEHLYIDNFCFKARTGRKRFDVFGRGRHHECRKCQNDKFLRMDLRQKLLYAARGRAKKAGFPCTITVDDIVIPEACPVLGIPLFPSVGNGRKHPALIPNSPSIDRLDNDKGYTPDNIRVISMRANDIKSNATLQELEAVVAYVKENLFPTPFSNDFNGGGSV
jgi:hypothetical protein